MSCVCISSSGAAVGAVFALTMLLVGALLYEGIRSSRESLASGFDARAELAASFTAEYLQQVAAREMKLARNRLDGDIDAASLEQIAIDQEFAASVVLDERGRLLQGFPSAPDLLNTDLAKRYAHLRGAAGGRVSISPVISSAARDEPIVAVAVPFQSPSGRRVFSSGFRISETPLDTFVHSISQSGGAAYIVDGNGRIVASSGDSAARAGLLLGDQSAQLGQLLRKPRGELERNGASHRFASRPVEGTAWRIFTTVPTAVLYRPLRPVFALQIALSIVIGALACAVTLLVKRLLRAERRLGSQVVELGTRETRLSFMLDEVDRVRNDERRRITEEIHDSSLQQIIAARMTLDHLGMVDRDRQPGLLTKIGELLDVAVSTTRTVLQGYSPLHTAHKPLDEALATFLVDLQKSYTTPISAAIDAPVRIDEERHLVVVRMSAELVVNACKHAGASGIEISGFVESGALHLTVADNGCGFDYDSNSSFNGDTSIGMGLPLMQQRIRALGGHMRVDSTVGVGTTVQLLIPLGTGAQSASFAPSGS